MPNDDRWRKALLYVLWVGSIALLALAGGCASCGTCRGGEVAASTQTDAAPPPPAVPGNPFTTPGEQPKAQAPAMATPVAPSSPVAASLPGLSASPGAVVITNNSAPVYYGTQQPPAQIPAHASAASAAIPSPLPPIPGYFLNSSPAVAQAFPLVPGPVPDSVVFALAGRAVGRLKLATRVFFTGQCPPAKAAAPVATATGFTTPAAYPAAGVQAASHALVHVASTMSTTTTTTVQHSYAPVAQPVAQPAAAPQPERAPEPVRASQQGEQPAATKTGHPWRIFHR